MEVMENNISAKVTPYGVLYKNSNQSEQVYNGKNLPPYHWKESMATVELKARGEHEFIYLPSSDIEIEKALMRLGVLYLQDCETSIDSHELPDRVLEMIPEKTNQIERLDILNKVSKRFKEMGEDRLYFEKLMNHVNPRTIDEILSLAESMYEFELFDGMKDLG
ncbi:MAG: hypothetical protein GX023_03825 [Tissierellia bacterium]|nr:hypothetical protein [Tissierellia bacterium]